MATERTMLERDHPAIDRRVDHWRLLAFVVAALVWVPAAVPATFVGVVGVVGLGSDPGDPQGLIDDPTHGGAIVSVLIAVVSFAAGFLALRAVARWSWPDDRGRADLLAGVASLWLPAGGAVVVAIRLIGAG